MIIYLIEYPGFLGPVKRFFFARENAEIWLRMIGKPDLEIKEIECF